jgi:hypothetical protein
MNILKKFLLATMAASSLVFATASLFTSTAAAQSIGQPVNVAEVACQGAQGEWAGCIVTLDQPIAADGTVTVSLDSNAARVLFCTDGSRDPESDDCGINGNAAVFSCPFGCSPGQQFMFGAWGSSNAGLAQSLIVTASGGTAQGAAAAPMSIVAPDARPPAE